MGLENMGLRGGGGWKWAVLAMLLLPKGCKNDCSKSQKDFCLCSIQSLRQILSSGLFLLKSDAVCCFVFVVAVELPNLVDDAPSTPPPPPPASRNVSSVPFGVDMSRALKRGARKFCLTNAFQAYIFNSLFFSDVDNLWVTIFFSLWFTFSLMNFLTKFKLIYVLTII